MGLGRIFDQDKIVPARNLEDRIHVGATSIEVHGHDHSGPRSYRRFDSLRVDIAGLRIDVNENGGRPRIADSRHCSDERVTNRNNFVSRSDSGG